ncbi:hypothetical protein [Haladaptatus sp. CMAA 1911]|uniref:hypothetical protein n=1 Tax=Haladaptatus sp. CMAA 1911 TaxID=3368987 RepID=UPI003754124B
MASALEGTAYWGARNLLTNGPRHYIVESDLSKTLTVLELNHETPGKQSWQTDEHLEPRDILGNTTQNHCNRQLDFCVIFLITRQISSINTLV